MRLSNNVFTAAMCSLLTAAISTVDLSATSQVEASQPNNARAELRETMSRLVNSNQWAAAKHLISQNAQAFESDADLAYLAAEAYLRQGEHELADKTAGRAAKLVAGNSVEQVRLATVLRDRGLKDWAERAYREVMDQAPAGSTASMQACLFFSEMLHDDARDQEAAKTLEHFVTRIRKDPAVAEQIQQFRDADSIAARMHYFFAQHHHRAGDHQKEKEHLTKANLLDPNDADILIAMYHLPSADEPWRTGTRQKITAAGNLMQQRVQRLRQYLAQVEAAGGAENVKLAREVLAVSCNEYAWLLANTQSDVDEAIRLSRESLELRPDHGGFLDTLAHGYHAKDDFENAVKYQRKAAEIEPHSGQISRQLRVFEESLAKSKRKE